MANQVLNETSATGEEGNKAFNFNQWITKHGLTAIKNAFIERDMNTLNTINMVDNKNFAALMSDYRVLQNTDLIPKIIGAIQSLEVLRNKQDKTKLVYMTKNENIILQQINKYVKNMDQLKDEFKTMNDEYENKKVNNKNKINQYQIICQSQLDNITEKIAIHIAKLHEIIAKREQKLKSIVNAYKKQVGDVTIKHKQTVTVLDSTVNNLHKMINDEKKHFEEEIISCKNVIKTYGDTYDTENENERQNKLSKIGSETQEYYDEKMKEIDSMKNTITHYLNDDVPNGDEKQDIFSLNVDNGAYDAINSAVNQLMTLTTNLIMEVALPIIQLKNAEYDTNKREVKITFKLTEAENKNIDIDIVKHLQIYVQCLSCTDDKKIIHEESIPYHNWYKMKDSEYGIYLKKQFPSSIVVAVKGKIKFISANTQKFVNSEGSLSRQITFKTPDLRLISMITVYKDTKKRVVLKNNQKKNVYEYTINRLKSKILKKYCSMGLTDEFELKLEDGQIIETDEQIVQYLAGYKAEVLIIQKITPLSMVMLTLTKMSVN